MITGARLSPEMKGLPGLRGYEEPAFTRAPILFEEPTEVEVQSQAEEQQASNAQEETGDTSPFADFWLPSGSRELGPWGFV